MKTAMEKQQGPQVREGQENSSIQPGKQENRQTDYPHKSKEDKQYDQQPEFTESRQQDQQPEFDEEKSTTQEEKK